MSDKGHYKLTHGFLVGGGLVVVGLMLQLCVGPVAWKAFAWPVNGVVMAALLALIVVVSMLGKRYRAFSFIGTYRAAIPTMVYAVVLTIVMGLTPQRPYIGDHNSGFGIGNVAMWLNDMLTFWPFVLVYVFMSVILGVVILRQLRMWVQQIQNSTFKFQCSLLSHLGLFLAMTAATLGSADIEWLKMRTVVGEPEWRAVSQEGFLRELPMSIELKQFIMESYDDGIPKRFASEILIKTKDGREMEATVDVNKPVEVDGWKIYQYGYDMQMGSMGKTSILELVRDPWMPLVYTGFFMMLGGALLLLTYTRWSYKRLLPIGVLVVAALCIVNHFMPVIRSTNLVPALQSPWFTPHVLAYVVCYSLMGVAAVMAIYQLLRPKRLSYESERLEQGWADNLVYVGLIFMTFGMMFGAFWAKEAWGHYWTWDPKETWAAITWLSYLVFIHYRRLPKHNPRLALGLLILSFILLQMCWWGINYLPSAQGSSVHTYST